MHILKFVVVFVLLLASKTVGENIVSNGGFELVGTGGETDAADWAEFGGSSALFIRDSTMPLDGDWALRLQTSSENAQAGVAQEGNFLGLPSLVPGTSVSLSFDVNYDAGNRGTFYYLFKLRKNNNIPIESVGNGIFDTGGNFVSITGPTFQVPTGDPGDYFYTTIEFFLRLRSPGTEPAIGFIDNVVIEGTFVPEPDLSCCMAVLLGMGILRMRKCRGNRPAIVDEHSVLGCSRNRDM